MSVSKKIKNINRLNDEPNVLSAQRQTYCKVCVRFSIPNYEYYMFY